MSPVKSIFCFFFVSPQKKNLRSKRKLFGHDKQQSIFLDQRTWNSKRIVSCSTEVAKELWSWIIQFWQIYNACCCTQEGTLSEFFCRFKNSAEFCDGSQTTLSKANTEKQCYKGEQINDPFSRSFCPFKNTSALDTRWQNQNLNWIIKCWRQQPFWHLTNELPNSTMCVCNKSTQKLMS